jgi:hypothetical protein
MSLDRALRYMLHGVSVDLRSRLRLTPWVSRNTRGLLSSHDLGLSSQNRLQVILVRSQKVLRSVLGSETLGRVAIQERSVLPVPVGVGVRRFVGVSSDLHRILARDGRSVVLHRDRGRRTKLRLERLGVGRDVLRRSGFADRELRVGEVEA